MKKLFFSFVAVLFIVGCSSDSVKISQAAFKKLEEGMTTKEVKEIVGGEPREILELDKAGMVEYTYDGEDGVENNSYASLHFKDDKLDTIIEYGLTSSTEEENKDVDENDDITDEEADTVNERDSEIQSMAKNIIDEDLDNVDIKEVNVNENMGLDDESYIVLPHLTWNVKNGAKTTREMLEMYSDHLAAKLADESDVSEITIFWEVPYHLEGDNIAKFNYNRNGDKMEKCDKWYAPLISS